MLTYTLALLHGACARETGQSDQTAKQSLYDDYEEVLLPGDGDVRLPFNQLVNDISAQTNGAAQGDVAAQTNGARQENGAAQRDASAQEPELRLRGDWLRTDRFVVSVRASADRQSANRQVTVTVTALRRGTFNVQIQRPGWIGVKTLSKLGTKTAMVGAPEAFRPATVSARDFYEAWVWLRFEPFSADCGPP